MGAGSVLEATNQTKPRLDRDRLAADPPCEDLVWEMRIYSWKLDRSGRPLDVKEADGACDTCRYLATTGRTKDEYVFRVRSA